MQPVSSKAMLNSLAGGKGGKANEADENTSLEIDTHMAADRGVTIRTEGARG